MALRDRAVVTFGDFRLDPDERLLVRDGRPVALTPKAFDLLVLLVGEAGHVLSKDELIGTLWQRRFVNESNLTKHIWMLRRALGESGEGGRYIETVPKLGYRFVAGVTRAAEPVLAADEAQVVAASASPFPLPPQASLESNALAVAAAVDESRADVVAATTVADARTGYSWRRWFGPAIAAMMVAGLAVVAITRWIHAEAPTIADNPPGSTLAIVQFDNLTRNPKDGWIGPALVQMLGTEIALGGKMHALPQELIGSAESGLPAAQTGGYAPGSLATLRKRLGADYVLSGSYLVAGASDAPGLRVDIAVQDARVGATLATFSRSGPMAELPALVAQAGSDLRKSLRIASLDPQDLKLAANIQPPTTEAMRRVGYAIDALHHYDPARARDELLEAVAEAPTYAPAYAYLAQAWSALGYKSKALAAAQQAEAHSADLPQRVRLQIATQRSAAQFDWPATIESLRKLVALDDHDPEYRLQLIDALLAAAKPAEAMAALDALRRLPGPIQNDPRIELAAARIASAQGDAQGVIAHAGVALEQAKAREVTGLVADAQIRLGIARSGIDAKAAGALFDQALTNFRRIGNPHGEASVHQNIGNLHMYDDPQRARVEYEHALAGYQAIGDRSGIAAAYSDIGIMLWAAGDRDGAQTAVRHVLAIREETGDIAGQAWALTALANIGGDEAADDEVIAQFRRALVLDETANERTHRAFTLFSLAYMLRLRGELAEAQRLCAEAQVAYAALADIAGQGASALTCAQIALDRGDVDAAESSLRIARDDAQKIGDVMTVANADLVDGEIALGRQQWTTANGHFAVAEQGYAGADLVAGQAIAASLLALSDAAIGNTAGRDRALARARALRSRITERQEVFQVDVAMAELRGRSGHYDEALAALQSLASDAQKRKWIAGSLEAKLAAVQLAAARRDTARFERMRGELAVAAAHDGFGWVLQRMDFPAAGAKKS
jgi:DNA-binding winged helix-turn-helix (wHTH) protein/tetratricopeptide (TPR) repeat protein